MAIKQQQEVTTRKPHTVHMAWVLLSLHTIATRLFYFIFSEIQHMQFAVKVADLQL